MVTNIATQSPMVMSTSLDPALALVLRPNQRHPGCLHVE